MITNIYSSLTHIQDAEIGSRSHISKEEDLRFKQLERVWEYTTQRHAYPNYTVIETDGKEMEGVAQAWLKSITEHIRLLDQEQKREGLSEERRRKFSVEKKNFEDTASLCKEIIRESITVSRKIIHRYYFSLNEEKQVQAISMGYVVSQEQFLLEYLITNPQNLPAEGNIAPQRGAATALLAHLAKTYQLYAHVMKNAVPFYEKQGWLFSSISLEEMTFSVSKMEKIVATYEERKQKNPN